MSFNSSQAYKHYEGLRYIYLYSLITTMEEQYDDPEQLVELHNVIAANIDDFSKLTLAQRQEFQRLLNLRVEQLIQLINEFSWKQHLLDKEDPQFLDCDYEIDGANGAKDRYEEWIERLKDQI